MLRIWRPSVSTLLALISLMTAGAPLCSYAHGTMEQALLQSPMLLDAAHPPDAEPSTSSSLDSAHSRLQDLARPSVLSRVAEKLPGTDLSTTFITTVIIAASQVLKEADESARLKGQELSAEQRTKLLQDATSYLLKSENFWMGVIGGRMVDPLQQIIGAWAHNSSLNGRVAAALSGAAGQLVTLVGWTLIAQLWQEAVLQLPTDQQSRAHGVSYRMFKMMTNPNLSGQDIQQTEDYRILQSITTNIMNILFDNPEMRDDWFANAFRMSAKGPTVLFTIALLTGAAVSGAVIGPLALGSAVTWFASVSLGLGLGLTAAHAPKEFSDAITRKIQLTRNYLDDQRLVTNEMDLRGILQNPPMGLPGETDVSVQRTVVKLLERRDLRRDKMTVEIEMFYDLSMTLQRAKDAIANAKYAIQHEEELRNLPIPVNGRFQTLADVEPDFCRPHCSNNSVQLDAIEKAGTVISDGIMSLQTMEKDMLDVYVHEISLFNRYLEKPIGSPDLAVTTALDYELKWTCVTGRSLAAIFGAITPTTIQPLKLDRFDDSVAQYASRPELKATALNEINYAYNHRFKENVFLGSLGITKFVIDQYDGDFRRDCVSLAREFQPNPVFWQ